MDGLELVVLFADVDAERFVSKLIERGIERRCLRKPNWQSVRDPMHDARVAREPTAALAPFLRVPSCRFVVILDHHGSGDESRSPEQLESDIVDALERAGVPRDRALAIVFAPELEITLVPVWDHVLELLARKRDGRPVTVPVNALDPKASWKDALRGHRLRTSAALFDELAGELSLQRLKQGAALMRLSKHLVRWFGNSE